MSTILFSVFSSNFAPSRRCWLLPRTWSHLWFAGVRECPLWCSIFGATVTVHQFFCILCFCHTCSLCHVELVVQFPTRGLTQVLLCLFPGVLWLWHFLYSVGPHPVSSLYIYTFVVSRAFMAGECWRWLLPGTWSHLWFCRGPWMSTVVLCCWCHSNSASFYNVAHDERMIGRSEIKGQGYNRRQ